MSAIATRCHSCGLYFGHTDDCAVVLEPSAMAKIIDALTYRHPMRVEAMIKLMPPEDAALLRSEMKDAGLQWAYCEPCQAYSPILCYEREIRKWRREHAALWSHRTLTTSWYQERAEEETVAPSSKPRVSKNRGLSNRPI